MTNDQVLIDAFERIRGGVRGLVEGCTPEMLAYRPDPRANPMGWLVWHLARVQDDHVAALAGAGQVWTEGGWMDRLGLDYEPSAIGYGQSAEEVGRFGSPSTEVLLGYLDAVTEATIAFLGTLDDKDLDRVVDRTYDPPVTMAVRLVSVISDDLQHLGQAAYVRGLAERA